MPFVFQLNDSNNTKVDSYGYHVSGDFAHLHTGLFNTSYRANFVLQDGSDNGNASFSILGGVSLGGINKFDIGSGFDLKLGNFCLHFAVSQSGGLFNSARGINVSSEFRFIF